MLRQSGRAIWLALLFLTAGVCVGGERNLAMAVEEAPYTVEKSDGSFEIRNYAPQIVAETLVESTREGAGNLAFQRLFAYISGENRRRDRIAMTAPVGQSSSATIPMTAPVGQKETAGKWAISFMMPAGATLETLPEPLDPAVVLRAVPERRMAAVRYSGTWSEENYLKNLARLEAWLEKAGLHPAGEPVWARYNPPFTLWFLRRNEILIPL